MINFNELKALYGPMQAVDVQDLLAWEDNCSRSRAMDCGMHETDAYHRAWLWITAVILDSAKPELPWHAEQAVLRVQTKGYLSTCK